MGDRSATLTFLAKDAASGPIKDINKALGHMGMSAKNAGKHMAGAAVNIAKIGAAAAAGGILALGAGLAYAAKEAVEEEKNIARLTTAITANQMSHAEAGEAVKEANDAIARSRESVNEAEKLGQKGTKDLTAALTALEKNEKDLVTAQRIYKNTLTDNTGAMNAAILAGEHLAFSDDDQRASISRLITSTKDLKTATELNALAMDFARLKGIDLGTAANIIGKVYDGNTSVLNRYGIAIAKGTSATEALAIVQKASAGQAEAYSKTTAGAWESFQILMGDVIEDIGGTLLPVLTTMAGYLTDTLVPAVRGVAEQFIGWMSDNKPLIDQIGKFVSETLASLVTFVVTQVIPAVAEIGAKFAAFAAIVVDKVIPVIVDFATRVWEGGLNKAVAAAAKVIGSVIEVLGEFAAWITSNKMVMAILSTAADLIGAAFGFIADAVTTALEWLGKTGDWITSNKPLMAGLKAVVDGIAGAFRQATEWVQDFVAGLEAVARWFGQNSNLIEQMVGTRPKFEWPTTQPPGKAAGGWVGLSGPEIVRVGERGPEYITPNNRLGASLTLAPGAIVVNGAGDPETVARTIMQALKRETQRQGMTF